MPSPLQHLLLLTALAGTLPAQVVGPLRCGMQRDYWLAKPAGFDARRPHWLVVLVHGFEGRGADVLWLRRAFAGFDDCLFVAPSFPEGFQLLEAKSAAQLRGLFGALRRQFRLHDTLFLCGFSAGAQFGHRFTMAHPELVAGCSAHGGGTWGPAVAAAARHVPLAVSCGLWDEVRSSIGQRWTRVQAAHRYFAALVAERQCCKARLWRGLGHATSPATEAMMAECYRLATRGLYPEQAAELDRRVRDIRRDRAAARAAAVRVGIAALQPALFPEPPPRQRVRAMMNRAERGIHDVQFGLEGLGGRAPSGAEFWIDDRFENRAGWVTNPASRRHRQQVLTGYLDGLRRRLQAGG